jgi:hypothetical protein
MINFLELCFNSILRLTTLYYISFILHIQAKQVISLVDDFTNNCSPSFRCVVSLKVALEGRTIEINKRFQILLYSFNLARGDWVCGGCASAREHFDRLPDVWKSFDKLVCEILTSCIIQSKRQKFSAISYDGRVLLDILESHICGQQTVASPV